MGSSVVSEVTGVDDLVVLDAEPGMFWFGAWHNINVLVWLTHADVAAVQRIDRTNPERVKAHPEKLSTVHIVMANAAAPDAATRDALNTMHAKWGHTVGCAAIVIERGGFLGVAVRSAIASMAMVAPKHYRIKVFDTIDSAAPWLAQHHTRSTGVACDGPQILEVLRAARGSAS